MTSINNINILYLVMFYCLLRKEKLMYLKLNVNEWTVGIRMYGYKGLIGQY